MNRTYNVVSLRPGSGEISNDTVNRDLNEKYKADTPLDKSFVPYLIMLFCAVVDLSVFLQLFKMISYDSPFMLAVEVSGFLFAFDVVPIYAGIELRRIKAKLSSAKFILVLAISVFAIALITNVALRLLTIDQIAPPANASVGYDALSTVESTEQSGTSNTAIALTVFGIVLPVLTSVGSFFISYITYNPLKNLKKRFEKLYYRKLDELRRVEAVITEYEEDIDFAENLSADDARRFETAKSQQRVKAAQYMAYVRQIFKERLGDPAATSALSDGLSSLLVIVNEELDKNTDYVPNPPHELGEAEKNIANISTKTAAS